MARYNPSVAENLTFLRRARFFHPSPEQVASRHASSHLKPQGLPAVEHNLALLQNQGTEAGMKVRGI